MLSRLLIVAILAFSIPLTFAPRSFAQNADGALHTEEWFAITFKDMREDLATANAEGKRLALIVEQYGCVYCRKLHEEVLSDTEVADFIKANYIVVQLNMFGDEEITDFDGEVMSERDAIRRWGLIFTPTVIFLPEEVATDSTVAQAAVQMMPGAFGKWTTLDMFRWVREKAYESGEHFQKYHARNIDELRAAGKL